MNSLSFKLVLAMIDYYEQDLSPPPGSDQLIYLSRESYINAYYNMESDEAILGNTTDIKNPTTNRPVGGWVSKFMGNMWLFLVSSVSHLTTQPGVVL